MKLLPIAVQAAEASEEMIRRRAGFRVVFDTGGRRAKGAEGRRITPARPREEHELRETDAGAAIMLASPIEV